MEEEESKVLTKKFWEYFIQTMVTDRVIMPNPSFMTFPSDFDSIPSTWVAYMVEAMEAVVLTRKRKEEEIQDSVKKAIDEIVTDQGYDDHRISKAPSFPCYGCLCEPVRQSDALCEKCKS